MWLSDIFLPKSGRLQALTTYKHIEEDDIQLCN